MAALYVFRNDALGGSTTTTTTPVGARKFLLNSLNDVYLDLNEINKDD